MAFSGGVFSRLYNWATDRDANVKIRADKMDDEMDGFATGLSTCVLKDGTQTITADLPMSTYKFTGLGAGSASGHSVRWEQVFTMVNGSDVASASDLVLTGAGNSYDVTGTTTITSIDVASNAHQVGSLIVLQFDDALTLTHHATDLVLPGGANITTAAGDIAVFWKYDTGDWRCVSYQTAAATYLANLVEDTTPQLGGNLDLNGNGLTFPGAVTVTDITGADTTLVSGTLGTDGDLAQWNSDGDLVDGPTPPSGTIVGTTDTQTLTNKTLGTGSAVDLGSDAEGDILYRNSSGDLARLGIGSTDEVLTVASGLPSWAAASGGGGSLVDVKVITSTTTYGSSATVTPHADANKALIFLTGAGASGAGSGTSSGGGAGATAIKFVDLAADIGASKTVTIGTASGGNSTINLTSTLTANGGSGGGTAGGAGGTASNGDMNIPGGGGDGGGEESDSAGDTIAVGGGVGGASFWGGGGYGGNKTGGNGGAAGAYGAGGGGAGFSSGSGGAGANGVCLILEFA